MMNGGTWCIHLTKAKKQDAFVALRKKRERELPIPQLVLNSLHDWSYVRR
jgi:hypothetical protein